MHHAGETPRLPIGESDAAMRFGFADLLRQWRAMNAIFLNPASIAAR